MWKVDNLQSFQSSFRLQLSQDLTSRTWKNGIKKGLRIKCGSWRGKLKVLQQSAQFWWTSSTASIQDLQELSTLLHHPKYPKSDQNVEMICPYDSKSTYIVYIYIPYELLSKPLLTLNAIQHLRFPIAFSTFGVLRIWGYRSIVL